MATPQLKPFSLDRMVLAVELVRQRLLRTARALEAAGVPYAVIGGNAVAAWVARVDPAAVRNTADVDILLRREDIERAKAAMEAEGFVYRRVKSIDMFIDRATGGKVRDAVHVIVAREFVREGDLTPAADVEDSERNDQFRVLSLESLVKMKLTSFRLKDQVHLQDMIEVGIIDATWLARLSPELAARFQQVIDTIEPD